MKRLLTEILFIMTMALVVSLLYNFVSPTGIKIIKKTSKNKVEIKEEPTWQK